jgi:hypothetical protein
MIWYIIWRVWIGSWKFDIGWREGEVGLWIAAIDMVSRTAYILLCHLSRDTVYGKVGVSLNPWPAVVYTKNLENEPFFVLPFQLHVITQLQQIMRLSKSSSILFLIDRNKFGSWWTKPDQLFALLCSRYFLIWQNGNLKFLTCLMILNIWEWLEHPFFWYFPNLQRSFMPCTRWCCEIFELPCLLCLNTLMIMCYCEWSVIIGRILPNCVDNLVAQLWVCRARPLWKPPSRSKYP